MPSDNISKPTVKFKVKVGYIGSSFRITIPRPIAEALELKVGEMVYVYLRDHKIVVESLDQVDSS